RRLTAGAASEHRAALDDRRAVLPGRVTALDQHAVDAFRNGWPASDDDDVAGLERIGRITLAFEVHDGRAAVADVPFADGSVFRLRLDDQERMRIDEAPFDDLADQLDLPVLMVQAARAVVRHEAAARERACQGGQGGSEPNHRSLLVGAP